MSKVTYFGNKTSGYKTSKTTLETLEPLLGEFVEIKTSSGKKNKGLRLIDMLFTFFRHGVKSDFILIDVYSSSAFYFAYILARLSFLFKKKFVLILHGGNLPNRFDDRKKKIELIFKLAHKVIAPSYYLSSFFESKGYEIEFIPNIIELNQYQFTERKSCEPKLLSIRGFQETYNPMMTVKAVEMLIKKHPTISLAMLGDKTESEYQSLVNYIDENELSSHIQLYSKMQKEEWIEFSNGYDIMISNPSIDNTPVSVIEGMALGLCVITTEVGGIPFLLNHQENALFVPSNDSTKLSSAIEDLLNESDLPSKLSINGRKKAEEFDWTEVKLKWKSILEVS